MINLPESLSEIDVSSWFTESHDAPWHTWSVRDNLWIEQGGMSNAHNCSGILEDRSHGLIDLSNLSSQGITNGMDWNPQLADSMPRFNQHLAARYDHTWVPYPIGHHLNIDQIIAQLPPLTLAGGPTIDPGDTLRDRTFSQLVVFGDSLSDIGNFSTAAAAFGITFPPFPFSPGRLSNGNLWVEDFASGVGLRSTLQDFAYIGSTTGHDNVISTTLKDLGISLPSDLKLPGILDQINSAFQLNTATPRTADPNGLYIVWGGANDFLTALAPNPQSIQQVILDGVAHVAEAVTTLAGLGAKTIAVANIPNLGLTPFASSRNIVAEASIFSIGFNVLLEQALVNLERRLNVDIVEVDTFSLSEKIALQPQQFGFTDTTDSLFQTLQTNPTANPNAFVFTDDFHPTAAVHQLFANLFESSLSQPVASHVLATSALIVSNLINSSGGRSAISSLLGSVESLLPSSGGTNWQQAGQYLSAGASQLSQSPLQIAA
jgi:phospholipase/lecithinase/hemolysin